MKRKDIQGKDKAAHKPVNHGNVFQEARRQTNLSQEEVAGRLNISTNVIRDLEKGVFTTPTGKLKRNTPRLVREVAKLYGRPQLEDYYCTNICPIGKQREQLRYHDIDAIRERLNTSLVQLDRSARTIVETLKDGSITEDEWDKCEEMLKLLQKISYDTKSAELWTRVKTAKVPEEAEEEEKKEEEVQENSASKGKGSSAEQENVYKIGRENSGLNQQQAADVTDIPQSQISYYEQKENKRLVPGVHEVINLSRAYLSPRIRNFYCYHDCEIGGKLEPLNVSSLPRVALMLVSSLYYVKDMYKQLSFDLDFTDGEEPDPSLIGESLPELKRLSRDADTLALWMQEELCARLRDILEDDVVTAEERPVFIRILGFLEELGASESFLADMRDYL